MWYWFGYFLVALAVRDLGEKHPPLLAVAVDVVIFAALVWTLYRPWHMGVRFDDRGVTVRNYFRTNRAAWAEVSAFTDGTTNGDKWALNVMLHDGRGVTATATEARPGSPAVLTAVRQAGAGHGVPAVVTGIAAERPRAWLDAASEAKRQGAWFAVWMAVMVIAGAGVELLIRWGRAHGGSYSPAGLAGSVAVVGLTGALVSRRKRKRGRRQTQVQDRCGEGAWFAVPLPKGAGFAPGLIARTEPRRDGLLLCYFFAPIGTGEPTLGQLRKLRAADAVLVQRLTGLAPKWPRLGQAEEWDRGGWPVPAFGRFVKKTGPCFLDSYDDDLGFAGEESTDRAELDGLPPSDLLSPGSAPTTLTGLLKGKPQQGLASAAGPQPLGDNPETGTGIPDTPGAHTAAAPGDAHSGPEKTISGVGAPAWAASTPLPPEVAGGFPLPADVRGAEPSPWHRRIVPLTAAAASVAAAVAVTAIVLGNSSAHKPAAAQARAPTQAPAPAAQPLLIDQLRPGDCLQGPPDVNTARWWPYLVTAVPCTEKHIAEVYFLSANYWPTDMAFPGHATLVHQASAECRQAFRAYDGAPLAASEYSYFYVSPWNRVDWASGDRLLLCTAYVWDNQYPRGVPLYTSIKGSYS